MPVYAEKEQIDGQKRWYIRTYVTDENGNKKQITRHNKNWIGREGKKEAEWEENRLRNIIINPFDDILLSELCDKYIDYIKAHVKLSTLKKNIDNISLYIKPFFKKRKIKNLVAKDILEWHDYLSDQNLSLRFKQDIHINLSSILRHGCRFYNVEKNVASLAGNFKTISSEKKEMNYMTYNEFQNFIGQEKNEIYKAFFTILFYSGLRRGELWCLTWDDINWNDKTIKISKSYNPKNEAITPPKTKKSNRTINILQKVEEALNIMTKYKENDFVFGTDKIKATTLQRKCNNNCKNANITKNIRIHDFRHSFASLCINENIPIQIISNYLGHESISTTLNIYGHLYPDSQIELVSKLNTLFLKQDQKQDQQK